MEAVTEKDQQAKAVVDHMMQHDLFSQWLGIRVEEIEQPLMREIRYLDKLIDELAKGKKMEKILRSE